MPTESFVPLNAEEHRQLGHEIKSAAARLTELERMFGSIYGPNNQAAFAFRKVVESIERLQHDLHAQALADLPGQIVDGMYR